MISFNEWKNKLNLEPVTDSSELDHPEMHDAEGGWKASKDEIMDHWRKLPPGMPMSQLRSVPTGHKGPTYSYDGLRITGGSQWINYVLSRLKDVLTYETEEGGQTRLQVIYKQIVDNKTQQPVPDSFVFYIQVKQRENKHFDKVPKIKPLKLPKIN